MPKATWLQKFRQRLASPSRRKGRDAFHQPAERLEQRSLLTATSLVANNTLSIFANANESIEVGLNPQNTARVQVLINGVPDNSLPAVQASQLQQIQIFAGQGNNRIDVSDVTAAGFSYFNPVTNERLKITIDAGNGDDTIVGSADFGDSIIGGHGNDSIQSDAGDDTILAGDGADQVDSGTGNDSVSAGNGDDTVTGGDGDDTITAGDGIDSVNGNLGNDSILGGDGEDLLSGDEGSDVLDGQNGNDSVVGGLDVDVLLGGVGNDTLEGNEGADTLSGQAGQDSLIGGTEDDSLNGQAGNDTVVGSAGNDVLLGDLGVDVLDGEGDNDSIYGGAGNDIIIGGSGNDFLRGQAGNDNVSDLDGADTLQGDAGNDIISSAGVDVPVLVSIGNAGGVAEGNAGPINAVFTVVLSAPSANAITVTYAIGSTNATPGVDFTPVSGSLIINPGSTSQTILVPVIGDTIDEPNESFAVQLTSAVGATIEDAIGVATITDDDAPSTVVSPSVALANALSYLRVHASDYGVTQADLANYVVTDQYTTQHNGVTQIYLQQTYRDIPIVDANINVNVAADGSVINAYSSFAGNLSSLNLSTTPALTTTQALTRLRTELAASLIEEAKQDVSNLTGAPHKDLVQLDTSDTTESDNDSAPTINVQLTTIAPKLQWVKTSGGGLELAWTLNVATPTNDGWWDASVSATTGNLLHNSSWIDYATYNVFNYNLEGPLDGARTVEVDPQDPIASPLGWHDSDGFFGADFTDTRGNNVFAQGGRNDLGLFLGTTPFGTDPRPSGGPLLDFNFPFNDTTTQPVTTLDAATTNLFYTVNILHDLHYQYGFDEASGNFQLNNYGRGGTEGDQVGANAQALATLGFFNNAFMATPPDGFSPTIAMFEFNLTNPNRDGDYENTIIIHEFGHGISNRLTGGPANSNALNALQSGGMGEGWSDFWSLMLTQKSGDLATDRRTVGNYVLGQGPGGTGIRRFPYSFDMSINPQTLGDFNGGFPNNEVHNAGELWTTVLWDMNWLLINGLPTEDPNGIISPAYGFDSDMYNGAGGNNIALQLVMDGLKLQPANPTFLDARDAILQADMINYGGANQRALWTAFARRGFGFSADAGPNADSTFVVEAFDMPPELGAIHFDQLTYQPGDQVTIEVIDGDRAVSNTLSVNVTMTGGDSEQVVLNKVLGGTFRGSIPLRRAAAGASNGFLDIASEASVITATYVDTNDGVGGTVTLQALSVVNSPIGDSLYGGDGEDLISGGDGADLVSGDLGNDVMFGNGGNDSMYGGSGNDTINSGEGNDLLIGNAGSDVLDGSANDDTFVWRGAVDGNDSVLSGEGVDEVSVRGSAAGDTFSVGQSGSSVVVGSGGASITLPITEELAAGVDRVLIAAGSGNDTVTIGNLNLVGALVLSVNGEDGNDILNASGALTGSVLMLLDGGLGNDIITGGNGADSLVGGEGADVLNGGAGNDSADGGNGSDTMNGGAGNDSLLGGDGVDMIAGAAGRDSLNGGFGNDMLNGGTENDTLAGDFGDDLLNGDFGDDLLLGEGGVDSLIGAAGNDTLDGGRNNDFLFGNAGNDKLRGDHGDDSIQGGEGDDTIDGGDGSDTIDAGDGNDGIVAGDGNDFVVGGLGNDTVRGGDGHDTLIGGGGNDILLGEDGDDVIGGGGGSDTVAGGQGNNTIANDPADVRDEAFVLTLPQLAKLDASN